MKLPAASLLLLALAAGCGTINVVQKQGILLPPLEFPLRSLTYPSGLRVLVERDTRTPLAGIFLVVGAGSTSDPAGKEGLAHYIEHLAFRSRPAGEQTFTSQLERAGMVTYNANTSLDATVYFEVGLASKLPEMLRLEGARMRAPVVGVTDAERATELEVVRNEIRQRNETGFVGEVLSELQAAVFPPGHAYARSIGGTQASLSAIRSADVQAFLEAHYRPENMTLLILGNVELETADKLVTEALPLQLRDARVKIRPGKRMPAAAPAVPDSPPQGGALARKEALLTAPELWIAWSLPRSFDSDSYLLPFVARAAEQQLAGLVEDDKDIAGIGMDIYPGVQASMLMCRISLYTGAHPEESRDRVLKELPHLWTVGDGEVAAEKAFAQARRVAIIGEVLEAQDLQSRGSQRVAATHFAQDPTLYSRSVRELIAMRQRQVKDYADPYVTPERARSVLFVPPAGRATDRGLVEKPDAAVAGPGSTETPAGGAAGWEAERLRALLAEPAERTTYRLPNGLTVILQRRAGLPLFHASVLFPAIPETADEGAAAEAVQLIGNPWNLLNGSPGLFGGSLRRETGADHLSYSLEGASGNAELILATLAEVVRNMGVDRFGWVAFQSYFIPALQRYEKDPHSVAQREFLGALLPGSPYGRTVSSHELEASSEGAAKSWIGRTHFPAQATLVVVGDFDAKALPKMILESFGNWTGAPHAKHEPAPPPAPGGPAAVRFLVTHRPGATQAELQFGCLLPAASESPVAARHEVGARILQERLWKVLREKMGATYGLQASATTLRGGTAYLEAQSAVESGKLGPVLGSFKQALAALAAELATPDEVAWAKVFRANGRAAAQMTNQGVASVSLRNARLGFPLEGTGTAEELGSISAEDVRADFQYCLRANPTLSIVGDEQVIQAALKEGWR